MTKLARSAGRNSSKKRMRLLEVFLQQLISTVKSRKFISISFLRAGRGKRFQCSGPVPSSATTYARSSFRSPRLPCMPGSKMALPNANKASKKYVVRAELPQKQRQRYLWQFLGPRLGDPCPQSCQTHRRRGRETYFGIVIYLLKGSPNHAHA